MLVAWFSHQPGRASVQSDAVLTHSSSNWGLCQMGTTFLIPDLMTSKEFTAVPGPWIFCRFTTLVLCYRWSSKACKVFCSRSKSSQINIISSTPWAYFSEVRKKNCDRSRATIPWHIAGCEYLWQELLESKPQEGNRFSHGFFPTGRASASGSRTIQNISTQKREHIGNPY